MSQAAKASSKGKQQDVSCLCFPCLGGALLSIWPLVLVDVRRESPLHFPIIANPFFSFVAIVQVLSSCCHQYCRILCCAHVVHNTSTRMTNTIPLTSPQSRYFSCQHNHVKTIAAQRREHHIAKQAQQCSQTVSKRTMTMIKQAVKRVAGARCLSV